MDSSKKQPAPEPNPADADRPVAYGKDGPPPHDRSEGPCSCGGPHEAANCPMPTA